jgi:uncharacterized DUF497 family protein
VGFEYDQIKSDAIHQKHGIRFEDAQILWNDPKRVEFIARFQDEPRLGLVAELNDKKWTAIFTHRNNRVRIISVRRARENEEELYNDGPRI